MTHPEPLAKVQKLLLQASADEVRLLSLVAERMASNRHAGIGCLGARDARR